MLDSEEKVQQRLPIPLPKAKFWNLGDLDEEADNDAAATAPGEGDLEVPSSSTQSLADQIHALTARFDTYWDEPQEHRVALSQDMDAIKAKMAIIRSN